MKQINAKWCVNEQDVLNDIKYFLKEYCFCSADFNGQELELKFDNGQKFTVNVRKSS